MKRSLFCFLTALFCAFSLAHAAQSLLILDTTASGPQNIRNLIAFSKNAGFKPTYVSLFNMHHIKQKQPHDLKQPYDALFFIIDGGLLQHPDHVLCKEAWQFFEQFAQQPNKTIGLFLPDIRPTSQTPSNLLPLLSKASLWNEQTKPQIEKTLQPFLFLLLQSNGLKSYAYDKSLFNAAPPSEQTEKIQKALTPSLPPLIVEDEVIATLIPEHEPLSSSLQTVMPLGMMIKNPSLNSIVFISKTSLFCFADMQEDFRLNPVNIELRTELLDIAQQTITAVAQASARHLICSVPDRSVTLPRIVAPSYALHEKSKKPSLDPIICAWMDMDYPDDKVQDLVDYIHDAKLNTLWFEYVPERFFSKLSKKTEEDRIALMQRIKTFVVALQKKYENSGHPVPDLFVGMNLTSNFNSENVVDCAQDLYGNRYTKIPAPLDVAHFWQTELFDTFDTFYEYWIKYIGNEFLPSGIWIDFEMYHAQDQAGEYSNFMDFSDTAWGEYLKRHHFYQAKNATTVAERVAYLHKYKKFDEYFATLQRRAREIGERIKTYVQHKLPHGRIGAYSITLPHNWFYYGIMSGLSTPTKPLILATFNNDFYSHEAWLRKNNIFIRHLPVIMLSKFKTEQDFNLIDQQLRYHGNAWFNKFSRLVQPYSPEQSWVIEASPLDPKYVAEKIGQTLMQEQRK